MKKKIRKVFSSTAAVLLCALSSVAANSADQLLGEISISGILSNPQGGFLLLLNASNPACGSSGNQFNVWVGTSPGYMTADGARAALAVALTAYALDKPIKVYFNPAIYGCPISQVWIAP